MRFPAAAILLWLTIGGAVRVPADGAALTGSLPPLVGDVSSWTVVTGEFDNGQARGRYRFYVSPGRQAMYRLMRYDVAFLEPGNDLERSRRPGERVVFVAQPGSREPLLCWAWDTASGDGPWHLVEPGTEAYQLEMMTLMRILAVHRALRRQQSAP